MKRFSFRNQNNLELIKLNQVTTSNNNDPSSKVSISKQPKKTNYRGEWDEKIEFILSCVGYAVGLGNLWRFPFKVLKNGGASFILAYLIVLFIVAIPLLLTEMMLAQFTSRGVTECWHFAPGLKGTGYVMLLISLLCSLFYNTVTAWVIYYFVNSFFPRLPWTTCDGWWNDNMCLRADFEGIIEKNMTDREMSSEQFWLRNVVTRVQTINASLYHVRTISEAPGGLNWYTAVCHLAAWTICALILCYGIKISGKTMYIFAIYPYLVITILIVAGALLKGSGSGLYYYLVPNLSKLSELNLWHDAAEQVFFSIGIGFGGMLTYSSYNPFDNNMQQDVISVACINSFTSIFAGVAVFEMLGFTAYRYGITMDKMNKYAGDGLVFLVYPEGLSTFKGGQVLCILFFSMVFTIGIDSLVGMIETVITGILDDFPILHVPKYRVIFVLSLHLSMALIGLLAMAKTGFYWYLILSHFSVGTNLLVVGFFECIGLMYIYGFRNMRRDFKMMLGYNLNWVWVASIMVLVPLTCLFLAIYTVIMSSPPVVGHGYHRVRLALWAERLGWSIFWLTMLPIPIYLIYFVARQMIVEKSPFRTALLDAFRPDKNWGPNKLQNWDLNQHYRDKFNMHRKEPDFVHHP